MGGSANSVISHENEMSGKGRAGKRERGRKRGGKSTIGNSISVISQENMKSGGEGEKAGVAEARRERMLAALRQAGIRAEGRRLWLHFRHLLSRAAGHGAACAAK